MQQRYTLICLLAFPGAATAQTGVLNASEMLPVGSEYTVMTLNTVSALDTTSGAGVVWQNGHLTFTGPAHTVAVLAPGATTWGTNFPAANYCLYESVVARHSYFTLNAQEYARVGFHISGTVGTYSDPQVEMVFPMALGSSNTDDWANNTVSFPGTYAFEVIGTGDLALAFGTFDDVLLLRVDVVNLFPIRQYLWVSAKSGAVVLAYTMQSLFGPAGGQIATTLSVGLDEVNAPIVHRVHQPSGGMLPVSYSSGEALVYTIRDLAGRLLTTGRMAASATTRTEVIDISMVGQGIHLIELAAPGSRVVERFFSEGR